ELANIYFQLGKYNESEKLIRSELSRIERIYEKDSKNRIPLLVILGKIKLAQGDYTTAEQLARKVLSLSKDIYGPNSSHSIPATMLLAEISSAFGDFENSQLHLEKSKELLLEKLGKDHIWMAEIYSRIGTNMLSKSEDPKEIELLFNEAKDIILDELDDQSPRYADMLKKLAYVKITQKDYSQAFQFLFDAEAIWVSKAGKRNNINASEIYVLLGDVYYMLRNFELAEEYYLKAKTLYEKFFSQNHPEYVKVRAKLSRVEYMTGNEKAALMLIEEVIDNYGNYINYFFPALSEREKAKFWNNIREDYEYYNTIVLKQIDNPNDKKVGKLFNNALHTKALLLNSSIKMRQNILNSGDSILIVQYENWILSKEILSETLSMSFDQLTEYEINLDS
ncbi:MAG: tetratricopeptide repeat protein, partial [Cyclobacteriaceae bacterium]|nr:tetratricopeptide repeat protein [Cyclobacteriaceae bacterium]